jgi:hypothetical protein
MGSDSDIGGELFDEARPEEFVMTKREFDRMMELIAHFDYGDDHQRSNMVIGIRNTCWSLVTNAMAHRYGHWARMDVLGLPQSEAHDSD